MELAITITLTVLLSAASLWFGRPRRTLQWWLDTWPMSGGRSTSGKSVTVEVNGVPVSDPHLNVLRVRSAGWTAIASRHFDQGRPVVFKVHCGGAVVIEQTDEGSQIAFTGASGDGMDTAQFEIGPQIIQPRQSGHIVYVSEGPTKVSDLHPFADVSVKEVRSPTTVPAFQLRLGRRGALALAGCFGLTGIGLIAYAIGQAIADA